MGRKQHQSDKLYLTTQEWKYFFGGKKPGRATDPDEIDFKRLPFDHCSLSLQPFANPYCDDEGHVFDLLYILPFIKKYKVNPCTGKPLDAKGLVKLKFSKNAAGEFHCPVMFKVFNNSTHIAVIKTTGNVFCYEAVEELNLKTKNFKDLLNDEPFTRPDIIILQDPRNMTKFNLSNYHHIKFSLKASDEDEASSKGPMAKLKKVNHETRDTLAELERTYVKKDVEEKTVVKPDKFNAATYSTGMSAASLTSTAFDRVTDMQAARLDDETVLFSRIKKKGYVRIQTNLGPLNIELYCDTVPKTCQNFITHCANGYYNNTIFHRSIRHFMVQGGDPEGTGKGGNSIWGKAFKDEFRPQYSHTGRGVVAMANSGGDSNKSQFYITYRSCKHLDNKHTIFGKLVGGMETLDAIERVGTDNKDAPVEEIKIERIAVFVNPYEEATEELKAERDAELDKAKEELKKIPKPKEEKKKVYTSGVGKYINPTLKKEARKTETDGESAAKKKKSSSYAFKDFSAW